MSEFSGVLATDFTKVAELGNGVLRILNEMRETAPIIWNESLQGWIVTRYEDVNDGFDLKVPLSNDRFSASYFDMIPRDEHAVRIPLTRTTPDWIVGVDPPRHTHIRKLARKAFSKKIVENIRPYARDVIDRVLTDAGQHAEVDFVEDVAVAITGRVMAKLLGVPEAHVGKLRQWSWDMNVGLGPARTPAILDQMEASLREMKAILEAEIEDRRRRPSDDFLSQLVMARDSGEGLTQDELLGLCYVTLSAGHDTTAHSMTLGFSALVQNSTARRYLVEHPNEIGESVSEVMRFIAMSTAQPRVAADDFQWHGQNIKKGDYVYLMIAAANRDPREFPNPEQLDLTRATDRSLVFASGIHHCIGHLLAKMQLSEFFPEAFRRYPNPKLLDEQMKWQPSLVFRGVEHLRVSLNG
jgi:cytochrome P450